MLFYVKRSRAYRCNISCSLQRGNFLYKWRNVTHRRRRAEHIYIDTKSICTCRIHGLDDVPLCNRIPQPCEYLLTCTYNAHSARTVTSTWNMIEIISCAVIYRTCYLTASSKGKRRRCWKFCFNSF